MTRFAVVLWLGSCLASFGSLQAETAWPQFRGPDGQGIAEVDYAPQQWSETQHVLWKLALPGRGWSSPVVAGDRAWVTTAIETAATPEEVARTIEASDLPIAKQLAVVRAITLRLLEIDLAAGVVAGETTLFEVEQPESIHSLNSYASPTPVLADGNVYCDFGAFGVACVRQKDRSVVWRRQLPIEHYVGPGSSPVAVDDVVILTRDGADQQYIAALDQQSGETVWKKDRPPIRAENGDLRKSFCTPLEIEAGGRKQVVIPGAQWFIAYDPTSGDEIWRIDHGRGFSNVPRPVFDGERLFLCTGFTTPALWAVDPTGEGDITATHVLWKHRTQVPAMSSPILVDTRLYFVSDKGILTCLDAKTGKQLLRERLGGNYSASPLLAAGKLYFASHEGDVTVLDADEMFEVVAVNKLDGQLMASPVPYAGDLLIRSAEHLYRISDRTTRTAGF